MALTDAQLIMLNELMYEKAHGRLTDSAGTGKSVQEVISEMTENVCIKGVNSSWDRISEQIVNDPTGAFANLQVDRCGSDALGGSYVVFRDREGQPYVVFQGTGSGEWTDNFEGLYETDTAQQLAAREVVEEVYERYGRLVVVSGHSKGGNKAQYCAITSRHVGRCVSVDGQGFGNAFREKYADEIAARSSLITNYCIEGDFVNCLLHPIGTTRYYQTDALDGNWVNNHADPGALMDEDGNLREEGQQTPASKAINQFSCWVDENASDEDKAILASFVGGLVTILCTHKEDDPALDEQIMAYIKEHPEETGLLMAYLSEYDDIVDLINSLLVEFFGVDATSGTDSFLDQIYYVLAKKGLSLLEMLVLFGLFYVAGKHPLLSGTALAALLAKLQEELAKYGFTSEDIGNITASYNRARRRIKPGTGQGHSNANVLPSSPIHDFSDTKLEQITSIIREINSEPWWDVTKWDINYRAERAFGRLNISNYRDDINTYYRKVLDISGISESEVRKLFEEARERDRIYGLAVKSLKAELSEQSKNLTLLQIKI